MWRLNNVPLSVKIPLLVAVMMIMVGFIASQQVLSSLNSLQAARIRELARQHVESLSIALGPHVLRDDIWEVYDTLNRAAGAAEGRRSVFSAVADDQGRVLAATDPQRAPVDTPLSSLSKGAVSPDKLSISSDVRKIKLLAPLVYQGRTVGQILTELDISDMVASRGRALALLLLGNALATSVLALLGYLVTRQMLSPISQLAARMRDTEGELHPIPDSDLKHRDAEIMRLVHGYNDMVRAVRAKADAEHRLAERERFVSLGRLSASLAHEINNPLGGLLNATDTIQTYADKPEVVRRSADLLARGLKHLRDVAKATLDQNRLERVDTLLNKSDFEDLHLLIGSEITHNSQTLNWAAPDDELNEIGLPAATVRQIVLNLLLNASRAAGVGGQVAVCTSVTPDALVCEIRDNGPGLSKDARERLLADGLLPDGGGVGLRVVRELVIQLSGDIETEREGNMTRITVRLPRQGGQ